MTTKGDRTADIGHMDPRQGTVSARLFAAFVAVALSCLFAAFPRVAAADESTWPTAQATAYNFAFVPYLDPPPTHAAVCLVDSGVNVTPDTPADSPDGPIVKRLALDGGTGEAAGTSWAQMHGTRMAMVAGAPQNGWGTIGVWPGVRIVSIRAVPTGEDAFPFDAYQRAIAICTTWAGPLNVIAVNLSLDCSCEPSASENSALANRIAQAHRYGVSVVASAGNAAGPIGEPASTPGVVSVGAGGAAGLCSFSNRGPALDLVGPGCEMDLADPKSGEPWANYSGATSAAAMTVSTTAALLRSYRPNLSWDATEDILTAATRETPPGGVDVGAAFRSAGLGALVDRAEVRIAATNAGWQSEEGGAISAPASDAASANPQLLPTERRRRNAPIVVPKIVDAVWWLGRLTVVVANRPPGARLVVTTQQRDRDSRYHSRHVASGYRESVAIRLQRRPDRVVARFEFRSPTAFSRPAYRTQL